ncbi:DUF1194 domain-containing protein [Roseivivax isoporae]|uniref:DUF1194 domain-containing protein n=1 Tax=Roseivivax isoporae TaxID=591206 RepID=UPI0004BABDBD|nr:DUF1194 domain-containing protein [Roseivivax isoporae]
MVGRLGLSALFGATLWAAPLAAQSTECRLALLLALDVSSSVDDREYTLQKDGLAAALADPDVRRAILDGAGTVALSIYEWSGRRQSEVIQDWVILADDAAIDAVVARLLATPRTQTRFPTAMGYALGYGAALLDRAPDCLRQVIDVSGDGVTNDGFGPDLAYRHFPFEDITVNGLAVLGADPEVDTYYRDIVRHGPGAFVEFADGYAGFRNAMTRKLFRETNDLVIGTPSGHPPEAPADRAGDAGKS